MTTRERIPTRRYSDHSQPRPVEQPTPSEPPRDPLGPTSVIDYLRQKEDSIREATRISESTPLDPEKLAKLSTDGLRTLLAVPIPSTDAEAIRKLKAMCLTELMSRTVPQDAAR